MKRLTDEEVEEEIARLQKDDDVKLARKEQQIKYRRRQQLYSLRQMKKHGAELRKSGITPEMLEDMYGGGEDE